MRRKPLLWIGSGGVVLGLVLMFGASRWSAALQARPVASLGEVAGGEALAVLAPYRVPLGDSLARAVLLASAAESPMTADPFAVLQPVTVADESAMGDFAVAEAAAAPEAPASLAVSAILVANGRRVAVVNEAIVTIGDRLPGGARVSAIERDHVVVSAPDGSRRTLSILDRGS